MDQSFTRLFQTCQEDKACNRQYPNLEQVFFDGGQLNDRHPCSMTDAKPDRPMAPSMETP
jgi:hypothetical protein